MNMPFIPQINGKWQYRPEPKLPRNPWGYLLAVLTIALFIALMFGIKLARAEETWKITSYCSCFRCCGKTDGITASGKPARYGYLACNWLKFGTKVHIKGIGMFMVQDRGAKSLFGSKDNHIKHLDIYMPTHSQALKFGVKYLEVTVL
jgi:3D (Asp-Asp-Asp) domain-containing protein